MLAVGLKTLYNRLKVLRGRIGPAAAEGSPPALYSSHHGGNVRGGTRLSCADIMCPVSIFHKTASAPWHASG